VLPALQPLREVTQEISDWPTFPQLYAKGELVGGCDIVEEMLDSGDLAELLGVDITDAEIPEAERILPGGSQTSADLFGYRWVHRITGALSLLCRLESADYI
jgi:hypothetical protein